MKDVNYLVEVCEEDSDRFKGMAYVMQPELRNTKFGETICGESGKCISFRAGVKVLHRLRIQDCARFS